MERSGLPLVNHLLQHTLRSLCRADGADHPWVYSIFWRILPRNYPPPRWDNERGPFERNKGNKRNWILVWEDGYCDFLACGRQVVITKENQEMASNMKSEDRSNEGGGNYGGGSSSSSNVTEALQPELFFKMSHDVYNYGEGLMGKVAADNGHKWIFQDPHVDQSSPPPHQSNTSPTVPFLSSWQASMDTYPRTWEAQFKAGIQTIAIIGVGEGLLQLASTRKVEEDVDFVMMLQRKFSYLQSIPGVFAHHPETNKISKQVESVRKSANDLKPHQQQLSGFKRAAAHEPTDDEACSSYPNLPNLAVPPNAAMYNSLQALLSKLPAVMTPADVAAKLEVAAACNASESPARRLPSPTEGPALNMGRLPDVWSESRRSRPPPPDAAGLANLSDEFESYHSLFGQLIS